ncbi:hypothetical protein KEM52_000366 [Ascosphaera acerosa]|nr:hypothetical protein KEM52_000366 [Ascosphaera acerosa]
MSSSEEADPMLVELLRQRIAKFNPPETGLHSSSTNVAKDAQYITDNAIDVCIDPFKTKAAAEMIYQKMKRKRYSTHTWAEHPLHPKARDQSTVDFIFTMDLLNFSFWSDEEDPEKQFAIEYKGEKWNGYSSLLAALQRALDEDIPITTPSFWIDEEKCSEEVLRHVFRSATAEQIPLFDERVACLREAGKILCEKYSGSFTTCIKEAAERAAYLVNLLADDFPCFNDTVQFKGKTRQFLKRAQILVADLWACFNGESYGAFQDIEKITMFAVGGKMSILQQLGCLRYSPPLEYHIRDKKPIEPGSREEIEIRGSTICCVSIICRQILAYHADTRLDVTDFVTAKGTTKDKGQQRRRLGDKEGAQIEALATSKGKNQNKDERADVALGGTECERDGQSSGDEEEVLSMGINAILVDFYLYDTMKALQAAGQENMPHHRTRSIWY